jgi:DNA-binding SARP family transcriptional activator
VRPDTQDKGDFSMSANRIYALGAAVAADAAFGASGPVPVFDAAVAAELLRQRIGGMGGHAAGHGLAHAAAVEGMHRVKPAPAEPHREALAHLVARAYSQLLTGDASAARRTLEHAMAMGEPLSPGPRATVIALASPTVRTAPPAVPASSAVSPAPAARVVVHTLGTFEVLVDGVALPEGKKQPRRTLALLKSIIALGGKDVCRTALADALWPELEGDKAQNALTVTLHRLRNYLGVVGAIPVRHGRLSLEPHQVCVDAFEFEAAARAINPASGCDSVERIFDLYRGPFLSADSEEPWTVRLRERLRSRFVSIVAGAAAALEARGRAADAVTLYERGLAADDLVGAFHDGLVRCLSKLDRMPEADSARHRKVKLAPAGLG